MYRQVVQNYVSAQPVEICQVIIELILAQKVEANWWQKFDVYLINIY